MGRAGVPLGRGASDLTGGSTAGRVVAAPGAAAGAEAAARAGAGSTDRAAGAAGAELEEATGGAASLDCAWAADALAAVVLRLGTAGPGTAVRAAAAAVGCGGLAASRACESMCCAYALAASAAVPKVPRYSPMVLATKTW